MNKKEIVGYLYWVPVIKNDEVPEKAMRLVSLNSKLKLEVLNFSMEAGVMNALSWCKKNNARPSSFLINGADRNVELFIDLYNLDTSSPDYIDENEDNTISDIIKELLYEK